MIKYFLRDLKNIFSLSKLLAKNGKQYHDFVFTLLPLLMAIRGLFELVSSFSLIILIIEFSQIHTKHLLYNSLKNYFHLNNLAPINYLFIILFLYLLKNAFFSLTLQIKFQLFKSWLARLGDSLYRQHMDNAFYNKATAKKEPMDSLILTGMISAVNNYTTPMINVIAELFVIIFLLVFLFYFSGWNTFLIILIPSILIWLGYKKLSQKNRHHAKDRLQSKAKIQRWLKDTAASSREIELYQSRPAFFAHYRSFVAKLAQAMGKDQINRELIFPMSEMAGVLGLLLLVVIKTVQGDAVSVALVSYLAIGGRLFPSFRRLTSELHMVSSHRVDVEAVIDMVKPPSSPFPIDISGQSSLLYIQNLGFKHTDMPHYLFQNVNLSIQPGEWIAIMGASGAGKSTLLDLIIGRLSPTEGNICWKPSGRQGVAYLGPTPTLLDVGLHDNLGFPDGSDYTQDEIREVLDIAQAGQLFTTTDAGLSTSISHLEEKLSTGERQRVALARAILHAQSLLILDEATAVLDNITESRFFTKLKARRPQLAVLMITHRESTAHHADRKLVLHNGVISTAHD